ncbi:MAG: serine hydrolase [Anaerobiospirillum succiniciproducens]|uniref:serine hydrolase n=1 Tax=Anaerobiospirillum succiniciproducens TaxID=13335 RepID=UPI002353F1C3|nr:serine hydrolase [Anaerobiospirillum succiniciproducens]MCI6864397.1 serine hydrolase [Anaerobiospirillum succiniciproducens]MDY2799164.1 serine hydrolase [Anaerobiospirillum succiniciproducens]
MDHSNGHKLTTFSRKGFKKLQYALVFALGTFFIAPNSFAEQIPDPFAAVRAQQSAAPAAIPTVNGPSPAPAAPIVIPEAPTFNAESWVLMDYATGQVLFERDQHKRIWPASLTKMMTSYVIGMEIKAGRLNPESYVTIPESAWAALDKYSDSSKMFIEVGKKVKVSDLNKGIVIQSGNDACVALAIVLAGSEEGFVSVMNTYAKQLGLNNTHFANVHGLFDEQNYSTAYDMSILGRALIRDLPEEYKLYSEKSFTFNGIKQTNRNRLLWDKTLNVDGIKTGHLSAVGYNLVSSSVQGNMRLIGTVIGAKSESDRTSFSKQMLSYGFRYFESYQPFEQGKILLNRPVRLGDRDTVNLAINSPVNIMIPRGAQQSIKISYALNQATFEAPIQAGTQLGTIDFKLNDKILAQYPLVAAEDVREGGFLSRIWDRIMMAFGK